MRPLLFLLVLAGCTTNYPQLVMMNPLTGATVDCQVPDLSARPADFLVSRACLSACTARGFRPVPGLQAPPSEPVIPSACSD